MGNKALNFCKGLATAGLRSRWPLTSISSLVTFCFYHCLRALAEDQIGYRFEQYREDNGRMGVETDSVIFDLQPKSWLTLQGEGVYDAISGFTPTGSPPPNTITFIGSPPPSGASSSSVPLSHMKDARESGSLGATLSYKNNRLTPQISFSEESDYISRGLSFNYLADFNDKNTTFNLGWSHDWDKVLPHGFLFQEATKNSEEILIGVNQLLNPKAVLTANFTFGHAAGYLNDQYRGVLFDNEIQGDPITPALEPEHRPGDRERYIGYVSLTQAVTPVNASVEVSYRFAHDTFGVDSHNVQIAWYQKLGKHVVLSPMFRYYYQNAAFFYVVRLPDYNTRPTYYSADYRLSNMETFAAGLSLNWKVRDWLSLDLAYQRYVMKGLDGITSQSAYPSANMFTLGARIWF